VIRNSCFSFLLSCRKMFIMLALTQLFALGCKDSTSKNATPQTTELIRIAAYTSEMAALVWIADQQGYFTKQGLAVEITGFDSGLASVNAVTAGTHDIATAADFVFARNIPENSNIKILTSIARSDSIEMLTHVNTGIKFPADLKRKKIGLTRKTAPEFFIQLYLLYNHIDPNSITIIDLQPTQLMSGFLSGDIDAAVTWEPNVWNIKQKLADKVQSWSVQSDQQFYFLLIGSNSFIEKRPEAAKKLLKSLAQAESFIKSDPVRAQKLLVKKLNLNEQYMQYVWPKHVIGLSLDQSLLVVLEEHTRWLQDSGKVKQPMSQNLLNYIYRDALLSVSPKVVTMIP
jgi:ABC-type nitrate/sulfonate/bicarbonate transport system substrate-binding protein